MATASFQIDPRDAVQLVTRIRGDMPKVIARAINKSGKSAKTAMVKAVRTDMGLKAKDVRDGLVFRPARFERNPTAKIVVSAKRISLIKFGGTQLKRAGYKSRLKGGAGTIKGAFVATIGGEKKVVIRKGKTRTPTRTLRGPSLGKVFAKHWPTVGAKRYREQMAKNLKSEIRFAARGR